MEAIAKLSRLDIIKETVEYYSDVSKRSMYAETCVYLDKNGNKCAFSRCCTDEGVKWLHKNYNLWTQADDEEIVNSYNEIIKPQYQGNTPEFWKDLQELHDNNRYWDDKGISQRGLDYVEELQEKYK